MLIERKTSNKTSRTFNELKEELKLCDHLNIQVINKFSEDSSSTILEPEYYTKVLVSNLVKKSKSQIYLCKERL